MQAQTPMLLVSYQRMSDTTMSRFKTADGQLITFVKPVFGTCESEAPSSTGETFSFWCLNLSLLLLMNSKLRHLHIFFNFVFHDFTDLEFCDTLGEAYGCGSTTCEFDFA